VLTLSFGVCVIILSKLMNCVIITVKLISIFLFSSIQRIACHIQVFALSRWLVVTLPVEYYGFAMGLRWSIPYFSLPWETERTPLVMPGSSSPAYSNSYMSKIHDSGSFQNVQSKEENLSRAASLYGLPLTPVEYRSYFEV
jgi:hypothetical protein